MGDIPALTGDEQPTNGTESEQVLELQKRLEHLGYYLGTLDGRYGDTTEEAVRQFQISTGQADNGTTDMATWTLLDTQASAADYPQQQVVESGQLSEEGLWQWNGAEWIATGATEAAGELSEDGQWQWNGAEWVAAIDVSTAAMAVETGRPRVQVIPVRTTPAVAAAVGFEENPRLEDGGVIAWAVKNIGQVPIPKGTLIGSWEIVDAAASTVVFSDHAMVPAPADLPPQGVQWIRVPFRFLPDPGQPRYRAIVQAGMAFTDFEFDWADPKVLPKPGPLAFAQRPHLSGGELRWSVRNTGTSAISAGASIGEWEIWAGDDITTTLIPQRVITATADIPPNGVREVPPIQLAAQRRVDGAYKAVVQLSADIAEVDYRVAGGQVLP